MGIKNQKGTVSVENFRGRIRLRWRFQSKRYSLNLASYNKINLLPARKIALLIEQDISLDKFDFTLNRYKASTSKSNPPEKSIVEYFEEWTTTYKQMDCEKHTNYNSVRNMLKKWGKVEQTNIHIKLNAETFCGATYNRRLTMLKDFVKWLLKAQIWTFNPLEDISPKKYKKAKH
ncbi:MAG: hypothetical protein B7Z27_08575 [Sphingobacteriia bacterium 32-37-4]|nr:MAG: hypothetical protein B7Z27_08575 [Sphingobacteriia bacterium 32-37-4]